MTDARKYNKTQYVVMLRMWKSDPGSTLRLWSTTKFTSRGSRLPMPTKFGRRSATCSWHTDVHRHTHGDHNICSCSIQRCAARR